MKKVITLFLATLITATWAQNIQVQNMANYLRNKEYDKAKTAADAAVVHESTRNSPKMWMYRGNVYKAIYSDTSKKVRETDAEAEEKALEAYINCLKNDKDSVYKDDVKGSLVQASAATRNKANYYKFNKEFDKAIRCFDLLEGSLPYDFTGGIKRNNITKEKLLFSRFELYQAAGNKEKTTEFANKLIEIKYKDPRVFTDMIALSLANRDTTGALSYIEKGKQMFDDNMAIIGTEIDIYLARKKTDVLKDKLNAAIELAPDNEVLHVVLADIYRRTNQFENAEKEYLKALELKPEYEPANYNLL
jgi:tetratricopeptide (TPR) repeat protein